MVNERDTGRNINRGGSPYDKKIVFPKELASKLRIWSHSRPLSLDVARYHPASSEMFHLARESAQRTERELGRLAVAVGEGTFDAETLIVVRSQIVQQLRRDPVFVLADMHYRTTTDRGLPLVTPLREERDVKSESERGDTFVLDDKAYKGPTARTMLLLRGATRARSLSVEEIAPLVYPHVLFREEALDVTRGTLQQISQKYMPQHPRYRLQRIVDANNSRKERYSIDAVTRITIHRDHDYIQINNTLIPLRSPGGVNPTAEDALIILEYLIERQGELVPSIELNGEIAIKHPELDRKSVNDKSRFAKEWLQKFVVVGNKPLIRVIEKRSSDARYGIAAVDVVFKTSDIPFDEISKREGLEVLPLRYPKGRSQNRVISAEELREADETQIEIIYYEKQDIIQIGEQIISLKKRSHSRAGHAALTILDALIQNDGPLKINELCTILYGSAHATDQLAYSRFYDAIDWIIKNITYNNLSIIQQNQVSPTRLGYSLADIPITFERSKDTLTIEREDFIVCPDGRLIGGKRARFVWEMINLSFGTAISYRELAQILYPDAEVIDQVTNRVSAIVSEMRPILEKNYRRKLVTERQDGETFLSSEPAEGGSPESASMTIVDLSE